MAFISLTFWFLWSLRKGASNLEKHLFCARQVISDNSCRIAGLVSEVFNPQYRFQYEVKFKTGLWVNTNNCFLILFLLKQEGDDYEVIPDSNFYVSRTAYRDNTSVYHISGKKKTFKDVGNLLRSHGIDLDHNRFLILQVSLWRTSEGLPSLSPPSLEAFPCWMTLGFLRP